MEVTIKYPFYKMDERLQTTLMEAVAKEIEKEQPDSDNYEDKANSMLAKMVFTITNKK